MTLDQALAEVARLRVLAYRDSLTGLPNRAAFEDELARRAAGRRSVAVLFVDLDGFKGVNDQHGHLAGDAVLRHAARRLQARLRSGDYLARIGGDEFVVLTRPSDAHGLAERLRAVLRAPGLPAVSVSVGAAQGHDADLVLAEADRRMYAAKRR